MAGAATQGPVRELERNLLAGAAFVIAIGVVMTLLPQLGHLPFNEQTYGNHATETPLPLN